MNKKFSCLQYKEKITLLKTSRILIPSLDPRARETSFKEFPMIRKAYKEILGIHFIDHFSINMVLKNQQMLVFSICPEIAYTLYSCPNGIKQDLAISPTFYENLDFFFWEDCYDEKYKFEIMSKKEQRFGIKAGAVIVKEINGIKYLFSFGTKFSADNFKQDVFTKQSFYKNLGEGCLEIMASSLEKYIELPKLNPAKLYFLR